MAGARAGLAGERSGLFMEQIRIIKEMRDADVLRGRTGIHVRPRFMCWENVPGAFSSGQQKGDDFRVVLEETLGIGVSGIHVPENHPWGWRYSGAAILGDFVSLLKTCVNAPCRLRMVISYEQNLRVQKRTGKSNKCFYCRKAGLRM